MNINEITIISKEEEYDHFDGIIYCTIRARAPKSYFEQLFGELEEDTDWKYFAGTSIYIDVPLLDANYENERCVVTLGAFAMNTSNHKFESFDGFTDRCNPSQNHKTLLGPELTNQIIRKALAECKTVPVTCFSSSEPTTRFSVGDLERC